VDAKALASQMKQVVQQHNASILSDTDTDLSSDGDGCSSTAKQGRLRTNKHSRWSDPDEQRLLAYTTEGKSWE